MLYTPPTGGAANDPYVSANIPAGIQGSKVPPNAIEYPQRELVALITASGLVPTNTDLQQVLRSVRSGILEYYVDTGAVNAPAIAPQPAHTQLVDGLHVRVRMKYVPTGPTSLTISGLQAPVQKPGAVALSGNEWQPNDVVDLVYNAARNAFQLGGSAAATAAPYYGEDTGTADALVVTLSPSPVTLVEGTVVRVEKSAASNKTTTPTLKITNMASGSPQTFNLLKSSGAALAAADLFAGSELEFILDQNGNLRRFGLTASDIVSTAVASAVFPQLVANPILYIRSDGNDANSGTTNSPSGAKATIAGAIAAASTFSFATTSLTIQDGTGSTYALPTTLPPLGGPLVFQGNANGQTTLTTPSAGCVITSSVTFGGLTLKNPQNNQSAFIAGSGGAVVLSSTAIVLTGGGNACGLQTGPGGSIIINPGCSITGGGLYALYANGGEITLGYNAVLAVTGSPAYTVFAQASNLGTIFVISGSSVSGSASGQRYNVSSNAVIQTSGGGVNFFPGTVGGTTNSNDGKYY